MIGRRKFSDEEKRRVYDMHDGRCAICGEPVSRKKMTVSHRIPLSRGGNNGIGNLMLACWTCNHMKNNLELEEFLQKVEKIHTMHRADREQNGE